MQRTAGWAAVVGLLGLAEGVVQRTDLSNVNMCMAFGCGGVKKDRAVGDLFFCTSCEVAKPVDHGMMGQTNWHVLASADGRSHVTTVTAGETAIFGYTWRGMSGEAETGGVLDLSKCVADDNDMVEVIFAGSLVAPGIMEKKGKLFAKVDLAVQHAGLTKSRSSHASTKTADLQKHQGGGTRIKRFFSKNNKDRPGLNAREASITRQTVLQHVAGNEPFNHFQATVLCDDTAGCNFSKFHVKLFIACREQSIQNLQGAAVKETYDQQAEAMLDEAILQQQQQQMLAQQEYEKAYWAQYHQQQAPPQLNPGQQQGVMRSMQGGQAGSFQVAPSGSQMFAQPTGGRPGIPGFAGGSLARPGPQASLRGSMQQHLVASVTGNIQSLNNNGGQESIVALPTQGSIAAALAARMTPQQQQSLKQSMMASMQGSMAGSPRFSGASIQAARRAHG